VGGLTWTIMIPKLWYYYLDDWLQLLEKYSHIKRTDFKKINIDDSKSLGTASRDDMLRFFHEQLHLMSITNKEKRSQDHIFSLTHLGKEILNLDNNLNEKEFKLHTLLNNNIFHYKFAFDLIINNQYYNIDFNKLKEKLIQASLDLLGFPIYDKHTLENIKIIYLYLSTIFTYDKDIETFILSDNYKVQFNKEKFIDILKSYLSQRELTYTYFLCEYLNRVEIKSEYLVSNYSSFNEKIIFEKLKDLPFIKFKGGIARKFVPSAYTIIELK